ncbi:MAG: alpha-amylase family glycosyl hydrolase [Verrucomicrobiota bacterium]
MNQKNHTPSWLAGAIFYEVYPQSFLDTNGDGIGDLPGVIAKLDYIRSIGCDAIWLNPCFESPFGDAGYDVSDYYKVAPRYGTNADLKRLFKEAHKRGMRVCLDLVAGHTSTEHPWFKESAKAQKNKLTNRYVWTDSVWHPAGPGLSMISGSSERDGNYVTNFFHFQPALNYGFAKPDPQKPWQLPVDHPDCLATREEMKRVMRYWLDAGADGFRVDMASSLVKGDADYSETMKLWADMRAVYDAEYPEAVLIAEWCDPVRAIPAGFHLDFLIHFNTPAYTSLFRSEPERDFFGMFPDMPPSFFDRKGGGDIRVFLDHYLPQFRKTRKLGHISIPSGNHDIMRLAEGRTVEELKVAFAFLLTMPGVPYIYCGDEIGMRYVSGLLSKEGGYNRTGSRTPMQWSSGKNAGFSTAPPQKLYLPVDPARNRPTVEAQESDPASLLQLIRKLTDLRKKHPALGGEGDFKPLFAEPNKYPFIYKRTLGNATIVVALNPSDKAANTEISLGRSRREPAVLDACGTSLLRGKSRWEVRMEGLSYGIFVL